MKQPYNNIDSIIGTVVGLAIIGAIVWGALECFDVNTGVIGGIFSLVPIVFLTVFVVWQIIKGITK